MTAPLPAEAFDEITVDLIFALRDSITDISPIDFWSGRALSAVETAAAGSETMPQAITTACRKLQIGAADFRSAPAFVRLAEVIGDDQYEAWAAHVARNIIYIVALAAVVRDERKAARTAKKAESGSQEGML